MATFSSSGPQPQRRQTAEPDVKRLFFAKERLKNEKEKMLTGEMYDASDPILKQERHKARALIHKLNITEYGNEIAYKRILSTLLPNAATDIDIEPPSSATTVTIYIRV